jgi:hypothetical protein
MRNARSAILTAAALAAVPLLVGGCGSGTGTGLAATPTTVAATPPVDCGRAELGLAGPPVPGTYLACFSDGVKAGSRTTLVVVWSTTEGDPITTTYRASGTDEVEVVVDSTQDRFAGSGGGITTQTCRYTVTSTQIELRACSDPTPVEQ